MLAEMTVAAEELIYLLQDSCEDEQIVIAGSIRRRKPVPSDIEIVAYPIIRAEHKKDLFEEILDTTNFNLFDETCERLVDEDLLTKRRNKNGKFCWGSGVKLGMYQGYKVDLFACIPPSQWGNTLAIRTGSGDFNKLLVKAAKFGGACPSNRKVAGGRVWDLTEALHLYGKTYDFAVMPAAAFLKIATGDSFKVIPTPTEEAFFAALGIPWWPPWERTAKRLSDFLWQKHKN